MGKEKKNQSYSSSYSESSNDSYEKKMKKARKKAEKEANGKAYKPKKHKKDKKGKKDKKQHQPQNALFIPGAKPQGGAADFSMTNILPNNLETTRPGGDLAGNPAFNGGYVGGMAHTAYIDGPGSSSPNPKPTHQKMDYPRVRPGNKVNMSGPKAVSKPGQGGLHIPGAPSPNADIAGNPAFNGGYVGGMAHTAYIDGPGTPGPSKPSAQKPTKPSAQKPTKPVSKPWQGGLHIPGAPSPNADIAGNPAFNGGYVGGMAHTAYIDGPSTPGKKMQSSPSPVRQHQKFNYAPQRVSHKVIQGQPQVIRVPGGAQYGRPVVSASGVKVSYGGIRPAGGAVYKY